MLGKLLKYEYKALAKQLVPMIICMFVLATVNALILKIQTEFTTYDYYSYDEPMMGLGRAISASFGVLSILVFIAFSVVFTVLILRRFYKNFFSDEGYLTHTLPVSTTKQLIAKLVSGSLWTIIAVIASMISIAVLVLFGTAEKGAVINADAFGLVFEFIRNLNSEALLYAFEIILLLLVNIPYMLLLCYLSITIGSIIAKKHKILAAVGIYFAISTVLSIIQSIFNVFMLAGTMDTNIFGLASMIHSQIIFQIVICTITAIVAFVVCNRILAKKLNLD